MKKNKIGVIYGTASFVTNEELSVKAADGSVNSVKSKYFIVATGSKPSTIPGVEIDKDRIITSTEALSLSAKPDSMVIIGGGVIGVEMASIFARIGVKITIIEYADSLIPTMDKELGKELQKVLTKTGITVLVSQKVQSARNNGESVTVKYLDQTNAEKEISAEYCLVAVGRKPFTEGLGLENTKIELDNKGRIKTYAQLRTAVDNIFRSSYHCRKSGGYHCAGRGFHGI